jgi:hypothetical protein
VQSEIIFNIRGNAACSGHNALAASSIVVASGATLRYTVAACLLSDAKSAEQVSSLFMQSPAADMIGLPM